MISATKQWLESGHESFKYAAQFRELLFLKMKTNSYRPTRGIRTDSTCKRVLETEVLRHFFDELQVQTKGIARWTEALSGFEAKSSGVSYDSGYSKYNWEDLKELYTFLTSISESVERYATGPSSEELLPNLSRTETIVACGFRYLQEKFIPSRHPNMNAHKFSVLKRSLTIGK